MNLRENKIDKFQKPKKKGLFEIIKNNKPKKIKQAQPKKKLKQPQPKKKLKQPQPKKKIQQSQQKKIEKQKNEKWTRKQPKPPLDEDKLDYQQDIEYRKEYSRYIKEQPENVLVKWRGPDFEKYSHSKRWYTWLTLAVVAIVFYAVWSNSIIMALVFVLIWIVGYLQVSRVPKVLDFAVTYDGILVGDEMYEFDKIKSFWIFYEPPHTRIISLHMQDGLRPYLHIPLHQVDPVIVHEKMVEFIPEEKQELGMVEVAERLLNL